MMDLHLFNLPDPVLYHIYKKLNSSSRKAFKCTCQWSDCKFSIIKLEEKKFKKIAKLILSNYDIIHGPKTFFEVVKFLFYPIKLTGLGECHAYDHHRWLNSNLVNVIWDKNSRLYIEGNEKLIELSKKNHHGQLKYLKEKIANTAHSWDVSDKSESGNRLGQTWNSWYDQVYLTRFLLRTCFGKEGVDLKSLSSLFEMTFDQQGIKELNEISEIIELKNYEEKIHFLEKEEMGDLKETIKKKLISTFKLYDTLDTSVSLKMENLLPKVMTEESKYCAIDIHNIVLFLSIFIKVPFDKVLSDIKESIPESLVLNKYQQNRDLLLKNENKKYKLKIYQKVLKTFILKMHFVLKKGDDQLDKAGVDRDISLKEPIVKCIEDKASGFFIAGADHFNPFIVKIARVVSAYFVDELHIPVMFLKPKESNTKESIEKSVNKLLGVKFKVQTNQNKTSTQEDIEIFDDKKDVKIKHLWRFLGKFEVLKESDLEEYVDKDLYDFPQNLFLQNQSNDAPETVKDSTNQTWAELTKFFDVLLSNKLAGICDKENMLDPFFSNAYEKLFDLDSLKKLLNEEIDDESHIVQWLYLSCVILSMELKRVERELDID